MKNNILTQYGRTIAQGMIVGGTMIIPGVSGGSMAVILGIYDRLIRAISSFRKDILGNVKFLMVFGLGSVLGVLLLAKPLEYLLQYYPMLIMYFFLGGVAGGVPAVVEKTGAEKFSWRYVAYVSLGFFIVLGLGALPFNDLLGDAQGNGAIFAMILAGAIASSAMLLPGISGSYMLLMLGLYDDMISAINNRQIAFLLPLALGMALGLLVAARLLEKAMKRYPGVTYLIILGFILGSLVEIFPGIPSGINWVLCPLAVVGGGVVIYGLGRHKGKN